MHRKSQKTEIVLFVRNISFRGLLVRIAKYGILRQWYMKTVDKINFLRNIHLRDVEENKEFA